MNHTLDELDEEDAPNRIGRRIAKKEVDIQTLIDEGFEGEELEVARVALDLSFDEYVKFQELKSLAVMSGLITLSEGMTIYHYLGNIPDTFNEQSLAVKAALTCVFMELL